MHFGPLLLLHTDQKKVQLNSLSHGHQYSFCVLLLFIFYDEIGISTFLKLLSIQDEMKKEK